MTPFATETVIDNVERYLAQKYAERPPVEPPPVLLPHEREFVFRVFLLSAALGACLNMVLK